MTIKKKINIGKVGKLILTPKIQEIINYLHMSIGAKEWSGVLFYKITKGDIKNLKNLEFTADFLYPMNIGSSVYTEFDYSGEIMNAYDVNENAIECSTGMIHTHHNMSTFFSGTDSSELKDNCVNFNYYISLIVNFDGKYCAKIALPTKSETKTKAKCKDSDGKTFIKSFTQSEDQVIIGDLDIEKQANQLAPQWLVDRHVDLVKKNIKPITAIPASSGFGKSPYSGGKYMNQNYNEIYEGESYSDLMKSFENIPQQTFKKTSTPKEFISALLNLDCSKKYKSIYQSIIEIKEITEEELEFFGDAIDANVEIFYNNLFDDKDLTFFSKTCKDSIVELNRYEKSLGENDVFILIKQILEEYAECEYERKV